MSATKPEQPRKLSFRELVESGVEDDGYEPQSLWLIPVFRKSRIQYYEEAATSIRRRIEEHWERLREVYDSRADFENSSLFQWLWDSGHPYWWGLNDVVGWIDIRACVRSKELQVSLFLPTKRISRNLKNKTYVFRRKETVPLSPQATNESLQKSVIQAVEAIVGDNRLKGRYVDLHQWYRLVRHTDLIAIIREAASEDSERTSRKQPKETL
jgi:hypothetical protein